MKAQAKARRSRAVAVIDQEIPLQTTATASDALTLPGVEIRFLDGKPIAVLSGEVVAAAAQPATRREFIDRLFSIASLVSLRLNWKRGEARLEFSADDLSPGEIVTALAEAMRRPRPATQDLPHEEVILAEDVPAAFGVRRVGHGLTLWQVDAPSTRFFRLSHPLLRHEFVRKQVLEELSTIADVIPRSFYFPLSGNESLIVFVRPHRVDSTLFQEVLDPVLSRCLSRGEPHRLPNVRDVLVNTNLGVAVLTDFLLPPLGIVNLAIAGALGAGYLPRAWANLREGKVTLELLYLVISSLTVITYQFLPAALMYWLMRYWPRRARELYDSHHAKFVARYRVRPWRVWIDRGGASLETRVQDLSPSSVVTLTSGDIVPGDGHVVEGDAQVDERVLTGLGSQIAKSDGSPIYAASRVVDGTVRIKIKSLGDNTAAGRLARWHIDSWEKRTVKHRAIRAAEKTVLPTLVLTALATLQGGLTAAKAAIRPDYATGPALSENLNDLATIIRAANDGILISGSAPLEKLIGPASVVFDDTIPWQTPPSGGATFADLLRAQGTEEAVFFSDRPHNETGRLAARLGFDLYHGGTSTAAKRAFIAQRQSEGLPVIYVGNTRAESAVAAQADLAIAVLEPPFDRLEPADFVLLSPDLLKFAQLRSIAAQSATNLKTAFGISLVPNVAATLSSFLLLSPVYPVLLLTNLGTFANFARSETILHLTQVKAHA